MLLHTRLRTWAAVVAVAAAGALALTAVPSSSADQSCNKVAAPDGSDSASGTETAPYRTVQHLVRSLDPGETGCLRAGVYGGDDVYMDEPETTLESFPGERATLTAFLEITSEAPRSRVSGLNIDTTGNENSVGTKLQADEAVLSGNVITKGGEGICVLAGTYYPARGVVIERNRMYDCGGESKEDGSHNKFDHLIYLSGTRGAIVRWNILTDNAGGWGVHMYPHAESTIVEHNIIDGNQGGVIFAGSGSGSPSDNNTVRYNAITDSGPRWNIESSWSGGPAGVGNAATDNCVLSAGPSQPSGISSGSGFTASDNVVLKESPYVNAAADDYRFRADSPCNALVGNVAGVVASGAAAPVESLPPSPIPAEENELAVTIKTGSHQIAPKRPLWVTGKVLSAKPGKARHVKLQVKVRKRGWRTIAHRSVRGKRFSASIGSRRVRGMRVARFRAVVPGRAHSRAVRVRVRHRG